MDHKAIGFVLLIIMMAVIVLLGVFLVGGLMVGNIPPQRRGRLLVTWFVLFGLLTVPQYYLHNFMSDGRTRFWPMVAHNWPAYTLFLSGWIASWFRTARHPKQ